MPRFRRERLLSMVINASSSSYPKGGLLSIDAQNVSVGGVLSVTKTPASGIEQKHGSFYPGYR